LSIFGVFNAELKAKLLTGFIESQTQLLWNLTGKAAQTDLRALQHAARELELERAATQGLRAQVVQLKDALLQAVDSAQAAETALDTARREGHRRMLCALQQQWQVMQRCERCEIVIFGFGTS
jgi:hypothetical protein